MQKPYICLSIAGSDPSGGAGIQADLKTFAALGAYGAAAITALTVQNTQGVQSSLVLPADMVAAQADAVLTDLHPDAVKIGMTGNKEVIAALAQLLKKRQPPCVVLDPVMVSTSGHALIDPEAQQSLLRGLAPCATVMTPNLPELHALCGKDISPEEGAKRLMEQSGCPYVLVKGGHEAGSIAADLLYHINGDSYRFESKRITTNNTHGTGCTLSSAIAAYMAQGFSVPEAVGKAKDYIQEAISAARNISVGQGTNGPVCHFFAPIPTLLKEI